MKVAGVVVCFTVSPSEGGSVAVIITSYIYIYIYIYRWMSFCCRYGCLRESKVAGADQDVTGAA